MLHFAPSCRDVPPKLDVCIAGLGPGGFIGLTAHGPNLLATNTFQICGAATEPETDFHVNVAQNLRVPQEMVSADFGALLDRLVMMNKAGDLKLPPVVDICTPTSLHARQISLAAAKGIRYIMTDKPAVAEIPEIHQVRSVLNQTGAKLWVTFNHRYNFIVAWLKAFVAKFPDRIVSIDAGFLQDWLMKEVNFRQANWRTAHKLCALLDILSHAVDLASWVAGSPITGVEHATVGMTGEFAQKKQFFDTGAGNVLFGNGLQGNALCSQSSAGHADDIYVCVNLKDGRRLMWRMEWNPDALFVGHSALTVESRAAFTPHLRGHSDFFAKELGDEALVGQLAQQYGKNPPGHIQGWDTLWYFLFLGIAGAIYRDLHLPRVPTDLPLCMQIEPPTFEGAGIQATAYVHAHVKSAEHNGARVELAEVLA
ncbi:MAG: hypothetical protein PHX87_02535 [Candidatus Peribacteraceae bacterium]|nr:hypothetical protein [Candidatus Peribacteraceae bacterium]MDD5742285.1 hypothetical protein [Candidatus Peribacteraceae bacterium]